MSAELTVLALAGLLQAVQYLLMAVPANLELGTGYTTGPRDDAPPRAPSPRTGRLMRALVNHFEALILFTLAVVVVTLSGQSSALTGALDWLYLAARVLYIPAYAFDWRPWRSLIWLVSFGSSILIIIAALLGAPGGA